MYSASITAAENDHTTCSVHDNRLHVVRKEEQEQMADSETVRVDYQDQTGRRRYDALGRNERVG